MLRAVLPAVHRHGQVRVQARHEEIDLTGYRRAGHRGRAAAEQSPKNRAGFSVRAGRPAAFA